MHADILCQEVYVSVSKISCVSGPSMCKTNASLRLSLVIPEVCRKYSNLFFHFFHRCAIDAGRRVVGMAKVLVAGGALFY